MKAQPKCKDIKITGLNKKPKWKYVVVDDKFYKIVRGKLIEITKKD